ncbi:MAG: DUF6798 domain-containing protein [Saprospiraceae bacterium]
MDFMPYAKHLQDSSLYTHDFYIQCLGSRFNERWLIAHVISMFPNVIWPVLFLIIHCFFTLLLIGGLKKWTELFIKPEWAQWTCLFLCLVVLYHRNLGGNELYYNMVCASLLAKSIGIWALYFAFKSDWLKAVLLTVLSTYIHPIVGVQILILSFVLIPSKDKIKYLLFSALGISPYVWLLFTDLNNSIPSSELVNIMKLRNAHHFFPASFGILNYCLLIPLFLYGTYIFYKLNVQVFYLMMLTILGCIGYSLGMLILPQYMIMTQWFKATIWLKFFSITGIVWMIISFANKIQLSYRLKPQIILYTIGILFVSFKFYKNTNYAESLYQFPWVNNSNEITTALKAKNLSSSDAVFIVPADFTAFKYYSERSTYVDWKAIPHNGQCLVAWSDRIFKAYGIRDSEVASLTDIYSQSNLYLSTIQSDQKAKLKSEGVDYLIFKDPLNHEYVIEVLK